MNWIREHKERFAFIVAIIFLVAITVFSILNPGKIPFIGRIAQSATAAVEKPIASAGSEAGSFFYGLTHFRSIQRENYNLKNELSELQQQLNDAKLTDAKYEEFKNIANELNYSSYDDSYKKVTADVVAMDDSQFFNIFTINVGSKDGLSENNIVINSDGLIGRVMSVGKNWAKVIGQVDSSHSVSFTVLRDPSVIGIVTGDGNGALSGYIFDDTKSILEGDKIMTSGIGLYPAGIEIGRVKEVKIDSASDEKTVEIKPSVDFTSLKVVTVLVA